METPESKGFLNKFSIKEPGEELRKSPILIDDEDKGFDVKNMDSNHTLIIIGAIIFIISISSLL